MWSVRCIRCGQTLFESCDTTMLVESVEFEAKVNPLCNDCLYEMTDDMSRESGERGRFYSLVEAKRNILKCWKDNNIRDCHECKLIKWETFSELCDKCDLRRAFGEAEKEAISPSIREWRERRRHGKEGS